MNTVNLKINNIPVVAPEGATILEAAHLAGIRIPTLCYLKEINAIGADKGSGLQALCRCLNIPISATIAIGDSENDRPLLRDADLPLAMGNAIADVKAAAQYVMPDCDHDGVAEAIERFLLAQS